MRGLPAPLPATCPPTTGGGGARECRQGTTDMASKKTTTVAKRTAAKDSRKPQPKPAAVAVVKKDKKAKPAPKPKAADVWTVTAGKGKGTASSKAGVDGVQRTRFTWNGCSLSSLLKLVGYMGGTLDNARAFLAAVQLDGVTSASTVSCQHSAGAQLAAGDTPHHGGAVAELDKPTTAVFRKLCGM